MFRDQVLNPLLETGLVEMTQPDSPRGPAQKYRLSREGRLLLEKLRRQR
jgi:ATP-dependent DNA helicase RecG